MACPILGYGSEWWSEERRTGTFYFKSVDVVYSKVEAVVVVVVVL